MMADLNGQHQAWQRLLEQPLAFVQARHLRECWPQALTDQQHAAICSTPRFQERRLQLLMNHFRLQALENLPVPDDLDLPVLLLTPKAFQRLPRLCGAIWHAATLSREIRSDVVGQLRSGLGNDVFALALANRPLAGAADLLRQPAELIEAIDRDGAGCVSAWLQQQPPGLRDWLRLRLDTPHIKGSQTNVTQIAADLDIVRRAAMTFALSAEEVA